MLVKLKEFPNGAQIVYQGLCFRKTASTIKDHFALEQTDAKPEVTPICLYLHRDTFVEPLTSVKNESC